MSRPAPTPPSARRAPPAARRHAAPRGGARRRRCPARRSRARFDPTARKTPEPPRNASAPAASSSYSAQPTTGGRASGRSRTAVTTSAGRRLRCRSPDMVASAAWPRCWSSRTRSSIPPPPQLEEQGRDSTPGHPGRRARAGTYSRGGGRPTSRKAQARHGGALRRGAPPVLEEHHAGPEGDEAQEEHRRKRGPQEVSGCGRSRCTTRSRARRRGGSSAGPRQLPREHQRRPQQEQRRPAGRHLGARTASSGSRSTGTGR